jgi:diguanylate cyclase (GGDEF)-like protein
MRSSLAPDRLRAIIEIQNELAACALDLEAVIAHAVRHARALTGAAGATIVVKDGEELVWRCGSGGGEEHGGASARAAAGLTARSLESGRVVYCPHLARGRKAHRPAARREGVVSALCVPLCFKGRTVGVLSVFSPEVDAFDDQDVGTLAMLSGVIAAHMTHGDDLRRHRHQSLYDPLTGLPNRRAFEARLGSEVARVRRHGGELSLCLLHLDGLRIIEETLGHAVEDEVLRSVGGQLANVRGEDAAFRIGGDEFAVILVGTDATGAAAAADRLRRAILADYGCGGVGVCSGVAELEGGDPAALLERATAALDSVKRSRP